MYQGGGELESLRRELEQARTERQQTWRESVQLRRNEGSGVVPSRKGKTIEAMKLKDDETSFLRGQWHWHSSPEAWIQFYCHSMEV